MHTLLYVIPSYPLSVFLLFLLLWFLLPLPLFPFLVIVIVTPYSCFLFPCHLFGLYHFSLYHCLIILIFHYFIMVMSYYVSIDVRVSERVLSYASKTRTKTSLDDSDSSLSPVSHSMLILICFVYSTYYLILDTGYLLFAIDMCYF